MMTETHTKCLIGLYDNLREKIETIKKVSSWLKSREHDCTM